MSLLTSDKYSPRRDNTLLDAINNNPWADWDYWLGLPFWTPEQASMLFLHVDPDLEPDGYSDCRAHKQVMRALEAHSHNSNKTPKEWATIFSSLQCFSGINQSANASHPFNFMIDKEGSDRGNMHSHAGGVAGELAKALKDIERLKRELELLQSGGNGEVPVTKTAPAVAARAEKTATKWALHLQHAVSLSVECAKEDKACSYDLHEKKWANRFGSPPVREALRAMRRGLPGDLVEGPR